MTLSVSLCLRGSPLRPYAITSNCAPIPSGASVPASLNSCRIRSDVASAAFSALTPYAALNTAELRLFDTPSIAIITIGKPRRFLKTD